VFTLGDESWIGKDNPIAEATHFTYEAPEPHGKETHAYVRNFEAAVRRGQQVVRRLLQEKYKGFDPAVIYVHPGWGDSLFLKEIFPDATVIGLFEFYYRAHGADVGFDPEFPTSLNDLFRVRAMNTVQLHALENCDIRLSPTAWQQSRFPDIYHDSIEVLHEGIDTSKVAPADDVELRLADGTVLRQGDEVLTYVNRGLDPYRGFHIFMRTLPQILRARPECRVLIVGGDKVHYGPQAPNKQTWRQTLEKELGTKVPWDRVHFAGLLPFDDYLAALRISRAHVYLTYPFILSWSLLEAMAAESIVIASDTAPVREFIKHGKTGLLVPFFAKEVLATTIISVLSAPASYRKLARAARTHIIKTLDFDQVIYPRHLALLRHLRGH
jgi:glycosyltransferase involved in cell wall biosynthesis